MWGLWVKPLLETLVLKLRKLKHEDEVWNKGIMKPKIKVDQNEEVDLKVETPGAAIKVAEQ